MTKVELTDSKLHSQVKWLNSLLLNVPNCTELNMKSCGLSAEDIKHLCEQTKGRDSNIEILNLENNDDVITEGPDELVRFVTLCPHLRKLYLALENTRVDHQEALYTLLKDYLDKGLLLYVEILFDIELQMMIGKSSSNRIIIYIYLCI